MDLVNDDNSARKRSGIFHAFGAAPWQPGETKELSGTQADIAGLFLCFRFGTFLPKRSRPIMPFMVPCVRMIWSDQE
jgi:hypothetical protein